MAEFALWHRPTRNMAELLPKLPKPDDGVGAYGPLFVYALALVLPIVVLLRRRSRGRRDSTPPDEESLLVAALRAEVAALRASAASPPPSTAKEDEAALRTEAAARHAELEGKVAAVEDQCLQAQTASDCEQRLVSSERVYICPPLQLGS